MTTLATVPAEVSPIVQLTSYQRRDISSTARFSCSVWSRQVGKSFSKSLKRIIRGIERRRNQIFISSGERQCIELMQKVKMHCKALIIDATLRGESALFNEAKDFKVMQVDLPGGVKIFGLPANPDTARGYTGDVLIDELAGMPWDREIWAAIFPSCLRGNGEIDVCSTPKGKKNLFYDLCQNPSFERSDVNIYDAVKEGLPVNIEELKAACADEMVWRQEFLCEFIDEATAFITLEVIQRCTDSSIVAEMDPTKLAKSKRTKYIGIDIGRKRDLTVIWIIENRDGELCTVTYYTIKDEPFDGQLARVNQIVANCGGDFRIAVDSTGIGMQFAEILSQKWGEYRVEPVTFSMPKKSDMASIVKFRMQEGKMTIPNDRKVINDFHSIEKTVTDHGNVILTSGRTEGSHADRFWAAALAASAADAQKEFELAMAFS